MTEGWSLLAVFLRRVKVRIATMARIATIARARGETMTCGGGGDGTGAGGGTGGGLGGSWDFGRRFFCFFPTEHDLVL